MKRQPISVFTPSNTDPEVLERIFVQRHRLLEKIVDRLKRSMLTGDMHHVLLIGTRGSGKTNMVTLAQHRLTQQKKLQDAMRVAWLGEDDTVTGLIDLALGIADRLAAAYPGEFDIDYRALYRGLPPDDAAEAILAEIHRRLQHRFLLLIVENLDAAFKGLGDHGQKRWRAFLQEKGRVATLATAQQLFDAVSDRDFPFWGFFDIHHLAPLSFEDARTLIRNISVENDNRELVQFLDTADGRYRIRSLHHLAGGNHRMYVLLSEFLTKESLDDLVAAFDVLADELTPYFQERVRSLPAQQAKIVQCLAAAAGATTVKEIAALTFIDERSCSKQLGELRNKRYVQSEKRGKESYYELSEPLMRLCLEVKNQRGKPLQLIARFLRVWFTPDALQTQLKSSKDSGSRADAYRAIALDLDNQFQIPVLEQIDREFEKHLNDRNYDAALKVAEELHCVDKLQGVWKAARVKHESGDVTGALADYTSIIEMVDASVHERAGALINRGQSYGLIGVMEKAIDDYTLVFDMVDALVELKATALINRGTAYGTLGETEKAIANYTMAIETVDAPVELKVAALLNRCVSCNGLGETEKVIADYTTVIEMPDAPVYQKAKALFNRGATLNKLGETEKVIADYTTVIEMLEAPEDQKAKALVNRGAIYGKLGATDKAIGDYTSAIETPNLPIDLKVMALFNRGATFNKLGETEKVIADYTTVIEMPDAPVDQKANALFNRGATYGKLGEAAKELADYKSVIEMPDAPEDQKAQALVNRGVTHVQFGEMEKALADFTSVIKMPDAQVGQKADAWVNRGVIHWKSGQMREALESFQAAIRIAPQGSESMRKAMFALPEPLIEVGLLDDVATALRRAFEENARDFDDYGGTPNDLFWMVLRRGSGDWDRYVAALMAMYIEFGVADKLARGLTQLIERLDEGNLSLGQLDEWNAVWQKHGAAVEEVEIALKCLSAATDAIKTKSDRPLFQLPQEIRSLVRALLTHSLGPVSKS